MGRKKRGGRNSLFIPSDPFQVPRGLRGSRAEVERKPLFLSRYCHYRAAIKGSFHSLFLFSDKSRLNEPRQPRLCTRKKGRVIISFGMKIGTDRFNKRIKIIFDLLLFFPILYSCLPRYSTLFLLLLLSISSISFVELEKLSISIFIISINIDDSWVKL